MIKIHMSSKSLFLTLRNMPLELLFALYAFIIFVLAREEVIDNLSFVNIVPIFIMLAYVININFRLSDNILACNHNGNNQNLKGRLLYWFIGLLLIPCEYICYRYGYGDTTQCLITIFILSPLLVLVSRLRKDNKEFLTDAVKYLFSLAAAFAIAVLVLLLFYAIFYSVSYIFNIIQDYKLQSHIADIARYAAFILLFPLLFFILLQKIWSIDKFHISLINKVLTWVIIPALIIYTVILYLYFISILIKWELPKGGIAYLVFGFSIASLTIGAIRKLLEEKSYSRYFDNLSLIVLPALIIFWIGVGRRFFEYGATEMRIYLILCGLIMTSALIMILSKKYGRYLYISTIALVLIGIFTLFPIISARQLSIESQRSLALKLSKKIGILGENNKIKLSMNLTITESEIDNYKRLYSAITYIEANDSSTIKELGLSGNSDIVAVIPAGYIEYVTGNMMENINSPSSVKIYSTGYNFNLRNIGEYSELLTPVRENSNNKENKNLNNQEINDNELSYSLSDGIITLYRRDSTLFSFNGTEMFKLQLKLSGYHSDKLPSERFLHDNATKLLIYRTDDFLIKFNYIILSSVKNNYRISDISIDFILLK